MAKQIKTIRGLASELARREGKKSKARVGDIREILGHLSDLVAEDMNDHGFGSIVDILDTNGFNRAKKRPKAK